MTTPRVDLETLPRLQWPQVRARHLDTYNNLKKARLLPINPPVAAIEYKGTLSALYGVLLVVPAVIPTK